MADLTITECTIVEEIRSFESPAGEAITAGQYVRHNTSSGKAELGNASSAGEVGVLGGIATGTGASAGQTVHVVVEGVLDVGASALDSLTFDDIVYLSNTDGTFADAAGTVSTTVATVVAGWAYGSTADKLLYFTGKQPS